MSEKSLRIATWNVASNKDYDALAAKLATLDIDICAAQEVSVDPASDLLNMLGSGQGHASDYHWYFAPALARTELSGTEYEHFGLALLSRIPLSQVATFQLGPHHAGSVVDAENEPRILQVAALPMQEELIVCNTHLASTANWSLSTVRRSQARKIANILRPLAKRGPLILCGDFNTEPSSSDLADIREALPFFYSSQERTYLQDHGRPPIDFFCSAVALDVNISVCPADGLSDHNIVVATFNGIGSPA